VEEESELDEIRRFKTEAYKRQQTDRDSWEQEVKKEIARIKAKNKALKIARQKRDQQARTMQKLQCLGMAKGYLASAFKNSMQALATGHHWRSRLEDQLHLVYKEWLLKKVTDEFTKAVKVEEFVAGPTGVIGE